QTSTSRAQPGASAPASPATGGQANGAATGTTTASESPNDEIMRAAAEAIKADPRLQWLRESITALIGLAITGVALTLLVFAFFNSNDDQRQILQLGLSLLGVVVGYYFGRVPAEHRADTATAAAGPATADA